MERTPKNAMRILAVPLVAMAAVALSCAHRGQQQSRTSQTLDRQGLETLFNEYVLWSDPGLHQRKDYRARLKRHDMPDFDLDRRELGKLLAPDCRIYCCDPQDGWTKDEYLSNLGQMRFMWLVHQAILKGPTYEVKDGHALIRMTRRLSDGKTTAVEACRLTVKVADGQLMITEIQRTWDDCDQRRPTHE